jgi:hypothetical protein
MEDTQFHTLAAVDILTIIVSLIMRKTGKDI